MLTADCNLRLGQTQIAFLYFRYFIQTDRYYALKEILYSILLMETSIEPEKIVINNLHSIY
jgi:hypothetical protein